MLSSVPVWEHAIQPLAAQDIVLHVTSQWHARLLTCTLSKPSILVVHSDVFGPPHDWTPVEGEPFAQLALQPAALQSFHRHRALCTP